MAHECPVCGMICHCNGDIDDIYIEFEEDILFCTHCPDDEDDFEDVFEDVFDCDNIEGGCGCCPYDEPICAVYFENEDLS